MRFSISKSVPRCLREKVPDRWLYLVAARLDLVAARPLHAVPRLIVTSQSDDLVGDALRLPQLAAPCVRKKQTGMGSAAERLYLFPWVASDPCYSDLIRGRDETDFPSLNLLKVPGYDFFLASSLLATRPSPSHSFVLVLVSSDRGVSGAC